MASVGCGRVAKVQGESRGSGPVCMPASAGEAMSPLPLQVEVLVFV